MLIFCAILGPTYDTLGTLDVALKNNDEINALKFELAQLKSQFEARINNLEFRIAQVDPDYSPTKSQNQTAVDTNSQSDANAMQSVAHSVVDSTPDIEQVAVTSEDKLAKPQDVEQAPVVASTETPAAQAVSIQKTVPAPKVPATPRKPNVVEAMVRALMAMLFDWFKPVAAIYHSYKERGMLGIFSLTIMGVGLTLAGFGYLMQLLIDQMGVGLKSLAMLSAALAVMALGIYLKRQTKFGEFATAIVSLGILLLYSTVYFAGDVYQILSLWHVVALYLVIALAAHALALWLDTKVIAALGIVGVAILPMLSDVVTAQGNLYLVSLALVTLSSLVLAYRYLGAWLANLTLAFVLVSLGWAVNQPLFSLPVVFIDVFYLLFFGYIALTLVFKEQRQQTVLLFLAALIGAHLLFFFQASDAFSHWLSVIFAVNSAAAIAASYVLYRIKHLLTHFMVLVAAVWAVLTAVSMLDGEYWGIAWAVEGLLLIAIGRRYVLPSVINQGQILAAIALFQCLVVVFDNSVMLLNLATLFEWIMAASILATVSIWLRLIDESEAFDKFAKDRVKPLLLFCESAWVALVLVSCGAMWLGPWVAPVTIVLQAGLLFRARACGQMSIELLAMSLIAVPLIYTIDFATNFGIYRFSQLPMFAKLSLVSALAQLWLFAEYYRRFAPQSSLRKFSEYARIAFYLIVPICWLGTAVRRLDESVILVAWLSPLLATCFAIWVKHKLIVWQAKILVGIASIVLIFGALFTPVSVALIATVLFMLCYGAAYWLHQRKANELYQYIASWGLWTIGMMVPLAVITVFDFGIEAHIAGLVYWLAMMLIAPQWWLAKRHSTMIGVMLGLYIVSSWLLAYENPLFAIASVLFVAASFVKQRQPYQASALGQWFGSNNGLLLHSVILIAYTITLLGLYNMRLDLLLAPILAVHGAFILFMNQRTIANVRYSFGLILMGILKLGLYDAANAVLWQKVVLFMGIGVLILLASFWYQRLVNNQAADSDEQLLDANEG